DRTRTPRQTARTLSQAARFPARTGPAMASTRPMVSSLPTRPARDRDDERRKDDVSQRALLGVACRLLSALAEVTALNGATRACGNQVGIRSSQPPSLYEHHTRHLTGGGGASSQEDARPVRCRRRAHLRGETAASHRAPPEHERPWPLAAMGSLRHGGRP